MTHNATVTTDPSSRSPYRVVCDCGWRSEHFRSGIGAHSAKEMHVKVTEGQH